MLRRWWWLMIVVILFVFMWQSCHSTTHSQSDYRACLLYVEEKWWSHHHDRKWYDDDYGNFCCCIIIIITKSQRHKNTDNIIHVCLSLLRLCFSFIIKTALFCLHLHTLSDDRMHRVDTYQNHPTRRNGRTINYNDKYKAEKREV